MVETSRFIELGKSMAAKPLHQQDREVIGETRRTRNDGHRKW